MFPADITEQPATYLESIGKVFARFGSDTQDSGNLSYGVSVVDQRYFFKTAGDPSDTQPYLDFAARQKLLRNAARLAEAVVHPLLPAFHGVIESVVGPVLAYEWRDGEHLGTSHVDRDDPATAFQRFRALPPSEILAALDQLFELHDLDSYHLGPYRNTMGRMFGASRFMAPEEFSLGAPIDDRTTAFVMARAALIFLSDGTLDRPAFRGADSQYAVLQEAVTVRFPSYAAFYDAWRAAS